MTIRPTIFEDPDEIAHERSTVPPRSKAMEGHQPETIEVLAEMHARHAAIEAARARIVDPPAPESE